MPLYERKRTDVKSHGQGSSDEEGGRGGDDPTWGTGDHGADPVAPLERDLGLALLPLGVVGLLVHERVGEAEQLAPVFVVLRLPTAAASTAAAARRRRIQARGAWGATWVQRPRFTHMRALRSASHISAVCGPWRVQLYLAHMPSTSLRRYHRFRTEYGKGSLIHLCVRWE